MLGGQRWTLGDRGDRFGNGNITKGLQAPTDSSRTTPGALLTVHDAQDAFCIPPLCSNSTTRTPPRLGCGDLHAFRIHSSQECTTHPPTSNGVGRGLRTPSLLGQVH
jgi:hypothetical protein